MIYLLLALSPVIFYLRMFWGFFQQDEWLGYSQYVLHKGQNFGGLLAYFFTASIGHFTPFTIATVHSLIGLGDCRPGWALVGNIWAFSHNLYSEVQDF